MKLLSKEQKIAKENLIGDWFEHCIIITPLGESLFSECYENYIDFAVKKECLFESKKTFSIIFRKLILDRNLQNKINFKTRTSLVIKGINLI